MFRRRWRSATLGNSRPEINEIQQRNVGRVSARDHDVRYFSGHTAVAVVAAALIAKRLENPWRVLLALALPPLVAGMLWVVANESHLATDADERTELGKSVKSTISLPPAMDGVGPQDE